MRDLRDNLAELLITHHVGGHWRAPLSQRLRRPRDPSGRPIGCLVEADAADIARAVAAARASAPADRAALAARFAAELSARTAALTEARGIEGLPPAAPCLPAAEHGAEAALAALPPGIVAVLGRVGASPGLMAAVLLAGLRMGRPLILKPAPRAPVSPLVLMEAALAAGAPPGAVTLLQGGGMVTGGPLLAHPEVVGSLLLRAGPRAGLGVPGRPLLSLPG